MSRPSCNDLEILAMATVTTAVQDLNEHRDVERCYCYACVQHRNAAPHIFRDAMLRRGFRDADTAAELREHIGLDLCEDVLFLLRRLHSISVNDKPEPRV